MIESLSQISCQFDSSDENYDRRVFLRLASELELKVAENFTILSQKVDTAVF